MLANFFKLVVNFKLITDYLGFISVHEGFYACLFIFNWAEGMKITNAALCRMQTERGAIFNQNTDNSSGKDYIIK